MAEYEMITFRNDTEEPVQIQWFGDRPADERVERLVARHDLGPFKEKGYFPHVNLNYENGYIEVRKHTSHTDLPPARKRHT